MNQKVWIGFARGILISGVPLFGAAGPLLWPAAWAYLVLIFGPGLLITLLLAKRDPALLEERTKPVIQKDQPLWDRILITTLLALWIGWFVLMGLDARFGWSAGPVWLEWVGAAGVLLTIVFWFLIFPQNTFPPPRGKITKEPAT